MSLNDTMIRHVLGAKKTATRMRRYPEGDGIGWAIVETLFALWAVSVIVICVLIVCGVK